MNKFDNKIKVHFIGVGGAGMSVLCNLLINKGFIVSGSDLNFSTGVVNLVKKGLTFYNEHNGSNVKEVDVVIVSSAINESNPELIQAKQLRKAIYSRIELLQLLVMCYKNSVGICGCHGKTTASSMLANVLIYSGVDVVTLIGGEDNNLGLGSYSDKAKSIVCEVCEYNKNIKQVKTNVSVCLNIDNDHLDCYNSIEEIKNEYFNFLDRAKYKFINVDDEKLLTYNRKRTYTFSIDKDAYFTAKNLTSTNGKYSFDLFEKGKFAENFTLSVYGKHNVYNALSVIAVSRVIYKLSYEKIKNAILKFNGNKRRFEFLFEKKNKNFIADYAHHPTEILTTISLVKELFQNDYLVVFQPHTYSRTKILFDDFIKVLSGVNLIIFKEYPARESFDESASAKKLSKSIKKSKYADSIDDLIVKISKTRKKNVIILGAGDLYDKIKNAEF